MVSKNLQAKLGHGRRAPMVVVTTTQPLIE
jgi:hypothetical protein